MELKGIDVSSWQDDIDWNKVKHSGVQFALLRCHQISGEDKQFRNNANNCTSFDIPFGVYKYSYATNVEDAKREAKAVLEAIKGYSLSLPVFYDLEWEGQSGFNKDFLERIAVAFLDEINKAGYEAGVYCNSSWYKNKLTDRLRKYTAWIASYPEDDYGQIEERLRPKEAIIWQYSSKGKVPGINGNVDMNIMTKNIIKKQGETEVIEIISGLVSSEMVLNLARSWIGKNEFDGSHRFIVDIYNSHTPLARGYKVTYTDSWCDTFISTLFIYLDGVDLIGGTECGVEEHIKKFKAIGIWNEDGNITPEPGDIICYNWDINVQPNDGFADHIGIVESVNKAAGTMVVIEGNYSGRVGRRTIIIGHGNIRGYARPKYEKGPAEGVEKPKEVKLKSIDEIAQEVLLGKWGNGEDRITLLTKAGYDYNKVQARVNELVIENKAKEVIAGLWGNGEDRKLKLTKAGFNYYVIQNKVNELLK